MLARAGHQSEWLEGEIWRATLDVVIREDSARARRRLETALRRVADSVTAASRLEISVLYALVGQPARAKAWVTRFEQETDSLSRRNQAGFRAMSLGTIAMAEARPQDAVREISPGLQMEQWPTAALPVLARAYDLLGQRDSAIAVYKRFFTMPMPTNAYRHCCFTLWHQLASDGIWRAWIYRRLAELYEERGDGAQAAEYYHRFVELWTDADAELQPQVRHAKDRIAKLGREPLRR